MPTSTAMSRPTGSQFTDDRKQRKRAPIAKGTRLEVWWPLERQYFAGQLVNHRADDCWKISYDDGEAEWIVLSKETYRILCPEGTPEAQEQMDQKSLLARVKVGSRVEIFWEPYSEWFAGTIRKIEFGRLDEYLIQYDFKGETWENLFAEKFKLLDGDDSASVGKFDDDGEENDSAIAGTDIDPASIKAGTRIAIFFQDDDGGNFYHGTVLSDMISKGRTRKYAKIRFDDGDTLDVYLAQADVRMLDDAKKATSAIKSKTGSNKRNLTLVSGSTSSCSSSSKRSKSIPACHSQSSQPTKNASTTKLLQPFVRTAPRSSAVWPLQSSVADGTMTSLSSSATSDCLDEHVNPCPLCKTAVMEKGRSLDCHHTFCKECVMKKCFAYRFCPICMHALGNRIHLYNKQTLPDAFRAVVGSDISNGTTRTFASASLATQALSLTIPAKFIIDACAANLLDAKLVAGYTWNFSNAGHFPDNLNDNGLTQCHDAIRGKKAVHRLCLKTGQVLDSFQSIAEASRRLDIDRRSIARVCAGKQALACGFVFQVRNAVRVLQQGAGGEIRSEKQKQVVQRDRHSSKTIISNNRSGLPKPIERLSLKSFKVLAEYKSIADASRALNIGTHDISDVLNGKRASAGGFFFRRLGSKVFPSDGIQAPHNNRASPSRITAPQQQSMLKPAPSRPSKPVEKICLETGKIKQTYASIADASDKLKLDQKALSRVYRGVKLGGFFFRYQGSNLQPLVFQSGAKPVEQLCPTTACVLAEFDSIASAERALNIPYRLIGKVARSGVATAGGYFFRYQGSNLLPQPEPLGQPVLISDVSAAPISDANGAKAVEQICLSSRIVISRYISMTEAGRSTGVSVSGISACCNPKDKKTEAGGFGWRLATSSSDDGIAATALLSVSTNAVDGATMVEQATV